MPFRERVRRALGRTTSNNNSEASSLHKQESRKNSGNVYKPGEPMPKPKYRQPVDKKHKENLESFNFMASFAGLTRKRSQVSQYSPMGSRLSSRHNSISQPGGVKPGLLRGHSYIGQVVENTNDDTDPVNGAYIVYIWVMATPLTHSDSRRVPSPESRQRSLATTQQGSSAPLEPADTRQRQRFGDGLAREPADAGCGAAPCLHRLRDRRGAEEDPFEGARAGKCAAGEMKAPYFVVRPVEIVVGDLPAAGLYDMKKGHRRDKEEMDHCVDGPTDQDHLSGYWINLCMARPYPYPQASHDPTPNLARHLSRSAVSTCRRTSHNPAT